MPIEVACPDCGARYRIGEQFAGKQAKCRQCGGRINVPEAEPAPLSDEDVISQTPQTPFTHKQSFVAPTFSAPPAYVPPPPMRRRTAAPTLIFSDGVTKMISIVLILIWIGGLVWFIHGFTSRIGATLPEALQSKIRLAMALHVVWSMIIFAVVFVPTLMFTAMQACSWTKSDYPDEPYIRAAGAGSLPGILLLLLIKFAMDKDGTSAIGLMLATPAIL